MQENNMINPETSGIPLKRSTNYSATETAEIRNDLIRKAINAHLDIIIKCPIKTDLRVLPDVKAVTERYIRRCAEAAILPNFEGLAAALGISRKWAYEFCKKHEDNPTAEYLNNIRLSMASLRMSLAESKVIDNASAIFILKNSGFDFADRIDIQPPAPENPLKGLDPEAARQRLLDAIPPEDDDF